MRDPDASHPDSSSQILLIQSKLVTTISDQCSDV
jgi:hypothetical protein